MMTFEQLGRLADRRAPPHQAKSKGDLLGGQLRWSSEPYPRALAATRPVLVR